MTGTVPPDARRISAQLAEAFDRDQQLAIKLNEAQQRLQAANEKLWRGLHPDGVAAVYGGHSEFEAVQLEASLDTGSEVLSSPDPLGAIQEVYWEIHRGFVGYQHAAEDRRMLAADIGELTARFVDELQAAGWSEQEARNANVYELGRGLSGAAQVQHDIIPDAPPMWGNRLLATCLWDAWHSDRVPGEVVVEYTEAAMARAKSRGMSLYHWVNSLGGEWTPEQEGAKS